MIMMIMIIIKNKHNNSLLTESIRISVPTVTVPNNKSDIFLINTGSSDWTAEVSRFNSRQEQNDSFSPERPDRIWGPPSLWKKKGKAIPVTSRGSP
jgi:hypothetical protein